MVSIIFPMLAAFVCGLIIKRSPLNKISARPIAILRSLISNILLPFIIFQSFLGVEFQPAYLAYSVFFFLVMLISFFCGFLIRRFFPNVNASFPFLMASYEGGLLGYPLSAILYPISGSSYFAFIDMGQMIFSYFVFLPVIQIFSNKKTDFADIAKSVLLNPIFDAMILGLICNRLHLNDALLSSNFGNIYLLFVNNISTAVTYTLLFIIGYDFLINRDSIVQGVLTALCRTASLTAAGLLFSTVLYQIIPYQEQYFIVMLLGCTLPSPLCLTAINDFGEDAKYINTVIPYSTLITFLLFPVLLSLSRF